MSNCKLVLATSLAALVFSATSAMANTAKMYCVNDQGHVAHAATQADCDKAKGTMMTEKDMVKKQDKMKEDKLAKEDKMKEDKMK